MKHPNAKVQAFIESIINSEEKLPVSMKFIHKVAGCRDGKHVKAEARKWCPEGQCEVIYADSKGDKIREIRVSLLCLLRIAMFSQTADSLRLFYCVQSQIDIRDRRKKHEEAKDLLEENKSKNPQPAKEPEKKIKVWGELEGKVDPKTTKLRPDLYSDLWTKYADPDDPWGQFNSPEMMAVFNKPRQK